MSTYTIGEAAVRSGFSPSALRYYESIGLVEPSSRTAAQYRLYDDDDLARLAFIARAKQLGCTLDEINDLVGIWDGEQCGPVQKHFHDLVTTKLADTERQMRELAALAEQLRQAAGRLAGPAVDGPCDEGCACLALDNAVAPVEFVTPESAMSQAGRTASASSASARLRALCAALDRSSPSSAVSASSDSPARSSSAGPGYSP